MGVPDLKGLLPIVMIIFGLVGWGVVEFSLWISSHLSLLWI